MERLTEKVFGFVQLKACGNDFCKETCEEHDKYKSCNNCPIQNSFDKLAEYEDLDEQGLLLRLPCKVGTKVYAINRIIDYGKVGDEAIYCYSIIEREFQIYMMMDYGKLVFGRNVFLTKAEAEQKLKEMESDLDGKVN